MNDAQLLFLVSTNIIVAIFSLSLVVVIIKLFRERMKNKTPKIWGIRDPALRYTDIGLWVPDEPLKDAKEEFNKRANPFLLYINGFSVLDGFRLWEDYETKFNPEWWLDDKGLMWIEILVLSRGKWRKVHACETVIAFWTRVE